MAKVHGCIGESTVDFCQLAKLLGCVGEIAVDFRQLAKLQGCVSESHIGEIPKSRLHELLSPLLKKDLIY
jgi:hypothetical protein